MVQFRWGLGHTHRKSYSPFPHRISYSSFSSSMYQKPDGLPTRGVKHVSSTLVRCIVHSVATGWDWSDESETVGRWIHGEGKGRRWTESFGKSARAAWKRGGPARHRGRDGRQVGATLAACIWWRSGERGEERAITYAEMAVLNRRELDSSVGVRVWREGDIAASAGVAQPAGAENETYRDGRKERGLLQFRSLAAAPAVAAYSRWREGNRPRQLWRGRVSIRQSGCLLAVYVVGP